MGPLDQDARKRGRAAMETSLTATDKVYRSFRSGRPFQKTRLMLAADALAEVTRMRDELRTAMKAAGLDENDCRAHIIFQISLNDPPQRCVVRVGGEAAVLAEMVGQYHSVSLGAVFELKDPERGIIRRWAHP